jgi:hypothetical protein
MKSLNETIREGETKKRQLEESLDALQEEVRRCGIFLYKQKSYGINCYVKLRYRYLHRPDFSVRLKIPGRVLTVKKKICIILRLFFGRAL